MLLEGEVFVVDGGLFLRVRRRRRRGGVWDLSDGTGSLLWTKSSRGGFFAMLANGSQASSFCHSGLTV